MLDTYKENKSGNNNFYADLGGEGLTEVSVETLGTVSLLFRLLPLQVSFGVCLETNYCVIPNTYHGVTYRHPILLSFQYMGRQHAMAG